MYTDFTGELFIFLRQCTVKAKLNEENDCHFKIN